MTTDPFAEAAHAEAERRWPRLPHDPSGHYLNMGKRVGFDLGAQWAAAQETEGERAVRSVHEESAAINNAGWTTCLHCTGHARRPVLYPCGTIQALDSACAARRDEGEA